MKVYSGNCHEFGINARMEKCVTMDAKYMAMAKNILAMAKIFLASVCQLTQENWQMTQEKSHKKAENAK